MLRSRTALVVGAGVFGLTGALALRDRGWSVTVVDPGPVPHPLAASTDLSKLVRADYGGDPVYTGAMLRAFEGWHRWNAERGQPLYHETGLLVLSRTPMVAGTFEHDSYADARRRGLPCERLDAAELHRRWPLWAENRFADGYFNPRAGWVESGRVVGWLADRARAEGVLVIENFRCVGLEEAGAGRLCAVEAGGAERRAEAIVVAAGAWTPTLLPELAPYLAIIGQPVLHFAPGEPERYRPPAFVPWCADIAATGWYGFALHATGVVKVATHGAGRVVSADAPRVVTPEHVAACRAFLDASLPALANAPLAGSRLCLYCDSLDGDFWIDAHPARPGLFVATGGSGHAFKFAPLLGDWIADAVEGVASDERSRFAWRVPEAGREAARSSASVGATSG